MTDTKQDPCRVMAEKIWDTMTDSEVGDNAVETIAEAIRNHTIVPEMVEILKGAQSALYGSKIDKADCLWEIERLLAKAGRKP